MKVTDFVIDFCRSRCSIYWLWPNQIRTFSDLGCIVLCSYYQCRPICDGTVQ